MEALVRYIGVVLRPGGMLRSKSIVGLVLNTL